MVGNAPVFDSDPSFLIEVPFAPAPKPLVVKACQDAYGRIAFSSIALHDGQHHLRLEGGVWFRCGLLSGWTFGGGLELMVIPAWSLKVEYQHLDFGSRTATLMTPINGNFNYTNALKVNSVMGGMNYHSHTF